MQVCNPNTAYPDAGQTIRHPATAIFGIDSADRYTLNPSNNVRTDIQPEYNFRLYKGQSVLNGFIKRLALTEVNMEWNVPNVNTYNNKFTIALTGGDISNGYAEIEITVPTGFYTPNELIQYLQDEIDTALPPLIDSPATADIFITLDPKTLYVDIQLDMSGGDGYLMVPFTEPEIGVPRASTDKCTMYEMLGLGNLLTSTLPLSLGTTDLIQGNYASFLYTRYIDITSENLTKKQEVKDSSTQPVEIGASNILARLYIAPPGLSESRFDISGTGCNIVGTRPFILYKEYNTPKYIYWDAREFINLIDIKVYDDKGRPIYEQASSLPSNGDWVVGNSAEFQLTILASEN